MEICSQKIAIPSCTFGFSGHRQAVEEPIEAQDGSAVFISGYSHQ